MNYSNFVVKLVEISKQSFFDDNISVIEILVKFPQIRTYDIAKYYHVNDYVIIEGYISLKNLLSDYLNGDKQVEISVFKIYPFVVDNMYVKKIKK